MHITSGDVIRAKKQHKKQWNEKNRCDWLKENSHRWSKAQVKATEKVWGCRHSRARKDKCKK